MSHRQNAAKLDWTCRSCDNGHGKPYRNFGFRTSCYRCSRSKSSCCSGVVKPEEPSQSLRHRQYETGTTKAQQQVREAAAGAKKELQKLRQQNKQLQKKLETCKAEQDGQGGGDDGDDDMGGITEVSLTIEQLQARLDLSRAQGCVESSPEIVSTVARIDELRRAKLASRPGSEQLRKSERALKATADKLEAAKKTTEQLAKQLEESKCRVHELQSAHEKARQAHDDLVSSLRSAPLPATQDTPLLPDIPRAAVQKLLCPTGGPSDEILAGLGEWGVLLKSIRDKDAADRQALAKQEAQLQQAREEQAAAAEAQAGEAAKAAAEAEAARQAAQDLSESGEDLRAEIEKADPALRKELAQRLLDEKRAKFSNRPAPY